jgi:hypothetical protein
VCAPAGQAPAAAAPGPACRPGAERRGDRQVYTDKNVKGSGAERGCGVRGAGLTKSRRARDAGEIAEEEMLELRCGRSVRAVGRRGERVGLVCVALRVRLPLAVAARGGGEFAVGPLERAARRRLLQHPRAAFGSLAFLGPDVGARRARRVARRRALRGLRPSKSVRGLNVGIASKCPIRARQRSGSSKEDSRPARRRRRT